MKATVVNVWNLWIDFIAKLEIVGIFCNHKGDPLAIGADKRQFDGRIVPHSQYVHVETNEKILTLASGKVEFGERMQPSAFASFLLADFRIDFKTIETAMEMPIPQVFHTGSLAHWLTG